MARKYGGTYYCECGKLRNMAIPGPCPDLECPTNEGKYFHSCCVKDQGKVFAIDSQLFCSLHREIGALLLSKKTKKLHINNFVCPKCRIFYARKDLIKECIYCGFSGDYLQKIKQEV